MKLRIEKAVYGGDGLARGPGGKTIFVPGALPGELVEATMATDRRSFATSRLEAVLEASAERIAPTCEYVPRCGGCQYQHAGSAFQLRLKLDILKETLARAHVDAPSTIGSVASEPWGYRNRIRLQVAQASVAYLERGSHKLLPVRHCPIAAPLLEEAVATVNRVAGLADLCQEVEFFTNGDVLLASLWPATRQKAGKQQVKAFAERLQREIPALTGVGLFSRPTAEFWGQPYLNYMVCGISYQVSLGSFFQVNRFLIPELLQLVTKNRSGVTAWDLYAGAGLFSRALAFEQVTAVESEQSSADDLKKNLGGGKHRVIRASTLDFLLSQVYTENRPELIIVDPPRAGLGKEICNQLTRIGAANIIYISCDPATLARDLQLLLSSGYFIETMHLVDMFPQTFHLETVTVLARG